MNLRRTLLVPAAAAAVALLSGCAIPIPEDTWSSRVEEPVYVPPPPPRVLRKPADFRIYDPPSRKEYFLYVYQDEYVDETVVTVIHNNLLEKDRRERLATPDEHNHAVNLFRGLWKDEGDEVQLQYFNRKWKEEQQRVHTLLDQKIRYKKEEIRTFLEEQLALESDLASRRDTKNTFPDGDEKLKLAKTEAIERELRFKKFRINVSDAQLLILEYKRYLRDAEYGRQRDTLLFFQSEFAVIDLIPGFYEGAGQLGEAALLDAVRTRVAPDSWLHPQASMQITQAGNLVVIQRKFILKEVQPVLDRLREEKAARDRALLEAQQQASP